MTAAARAAGALTQSLLTSTALVVGSVGLVVLGAGSASSTGLGAEGTDGAGAAGARLAMSSDSYESRVQHYVNRKRAAHGLRALRFERCTDGVAEAWSSNLAVTGSFVHQDTGDILGTCHARYAAETLGRGGYSPKALVRAWMRSPYHRPILLSRKATRIGIGANLVGGTWVTAANFTRF
jgi:uncharacterized protein YkwD